MLIVSRPMRPLPVTWIAALLVCFLCASIGRAEDLNSLYRDNYEAFFSRWKAQAKLATNCTDTAATARFLADAVEMLGNSEVTEENAEVIEELCIDQPACLLKALDSLPPSQQERVIRFYLVSPLFRDEVEIADSLRPHWGRGKYRRLYDRYSKIKSNG